MSDKQVKTTIKPSQDEVQQTRDILSEGKPLEETQQGTAEPQSRDLDNAHISQTGGATLRGAMNAARKTDPEKDADRDQNNNADSRGDVLPR